MSKDKKTKYDNKIKLLQEYKNALDNNNFISKKELLDYIIQELKELKKKTDHEFDNLTLEEFLKTFENSKKLSSDVKK